MSVPTPPVISVRPRVTPTTLEFWWQPPEEPNGTISGYTLSCASPSITQTYSGETYSALITGLTAGTDYTFTIIATNENGNSDPATYRTVRTSAKPQPVATLTASNSVSGGLLSITFTWTNPGGGDYAYYYVIGLRAAAGTKNYIYRGTRTYSTLSYTIGGLDPTQLYAFHVQRGNDAGYSTQVLVTTTRPSYFDPTSIAGLQVWYDAADTAGNGSTVADGTAIATWVDKSGNSRNATAAGGSATLQTDSAGRRLTFNGTSNRYNLPSSSWMYNTPYTVFVADTPSKINNAALIANSNGSADAFAMKYTTGTTIRLAGGYGNARIIYSYDGINWLPSSTDNIYPVAGTQCSVVATNGIICIAGFAGSAPAMYSYDGIKWITSSPPINGIVALAWNGTIWVGGAAVVPGFSSAIFTSPDGIKWTDTATGIFSDGCAAVAWNGSIWVAGGYGTNTLAYSYDGAAWIASTSGNAAFTVGCSAVAWNGTKWVAGGSGTNQLAYSSDGITWTASASGNAVFTTVCNAVAWNGTKWVAGGQGTNQLAYSSNGETWTAATSPITTAVYTVSWDGTQWIAGGYGTNVLAYSADGETWTAATSVNALLTRSYASTALISGPTTYNASITTTQAAAFVAGGAGPNKLAYSYDGITWTGSTSGNTVFGMCSAVATNGTLWVAGGQTTNQLAYSYDGVNWTGSTSGNAIFTSACNGVAWNGTKWVAGGQGGNQLAYSSDGITWTASTSGNGVFTSLCYAVAWNGTRWVAGGEGTNRLAYSSDGETWTASTSGSAVFTSQCYAVAWNGTRWVAGGNGTNQLAYSSDGIAWTASTSGNGVLTTVCNAVAGNGTIWVAGGYGTNQVAYSTDGITWAASSSGNALFGSAALAFAWNGTRWVAGGYDANNLAYSSDGITWTASTSGNSLFTVNGRCNALAYGNVAFTLNTAVETTAPKTGTRDISGNIWVAGGSGTNQVAYSYDGVNWSPSTSGNAIFTSNNICRAFAWNGTRWVAGGNGDNKLAYSSDGITWTASASGNGVFTSQCNAVAWNGTRWVAGGEGTNQLAYSADGITWTASASGNAVFTDACNAVAWNGTLFVAGGYGTNRLAYSSDGITWTVSESGNEVITISCLAVAWNGTRWVAGCQGDNRLAYSSDGITWTASESGNGVFTNQCAAVAWNGTRWVAGGGGDNQLAYSTDGISWTASTSGNEVFTGVCWAAAWNGTQWVAGGQGANQLAYSSDGITWTASTSENALFTTAALAVAYGTSITQKTVVMPSFVAGGGGTNQLAYSYDGITWTASTSGNAVFTLTCETVATNGLRWVAGGQGDNRLAYSTDGITWTASTSGNTVFTYRCTAAAWGGTRWVAGGGGGGARLAYSSDGITWTASSSGNGVFTEYCFAVAWNGSRWVAGGAGGNRLAYSSDGITWTASTSGNALLTSGCTAVAWNGSKWVAGGGGTSKLAYSSDGISWTASTSGTALFTSSCIEVAWNGTLWVAGGTGTNRLAYSYDGETWTASTSGNGVFTEECSALAWNGIVWTAGGQGTNEVAYSYDGINWTASTSGNALFTGCVALATSYVQEAAVNILSTTTGATRNLAWNGGGVNTDAYAIQVRDATLAIGAVQGSTAFYQGGMREILVYTGTLSDANKAQITDYLYNKWNPPALTLVPATPIKHGLVQWLDANDTSTLFQDLSGTIPASDTEIVRLWKDKSGNGYDMYNDSSSTAATVTVTTINYTLPGYSKPVPASKDITLFVVLKNNNGSNQLGYPTSYSLWQHNNLGLNGHGQTGTISFSQGYDKFSSGMSQSSATFTIYSVTLSKAQLVNLQQITISGISTVRDTVEVDSYYTGLGGPVVLCANKAYAGYIDVGEVIYYNRVLSTTEISSTITYLQNKWGVAAAAAGPNLTDNLQLWLDAADPYTVFQNAGVMTIWKDRSGNGYNATPSGSPTYSDGGVVFNGTSQYFNLPNGALPSGNSPYSYYAVIKPTDVSGVGIIGGGADTATFGQFALEYTKKMNTFMVAGGSGNNQLAYSYDGITWIGSTSGNAVITSQCNAVAWNGRLWVAGGNGGSELAYSFDGIYWTGSTSGSALFTSACYAVAWNGTLWVAGGSGGNQLAYSSDGITWTASSSGNAIFSGQCFAVAWNGTRWVAGGYGGNQLAYSSDGITWTPSDSGNEVFDGNCLAVAWNGTKWVAGGSGASDTLAFSSDGITWTGSGKTVFSQRCLAVAWNGTTWVAGGDGTNKLAYSSNGESWTVSASGTSLFSLFCYAVAWNGTRWVAGGSGDNELAYSSDGITWTASDSGNDILSGQCYGVASSIILPLTTTSYVDITTLQTTLGPASLPATAFLAGGQGDNSNKVAYSSDGITWTASTSGNDLFSNQGLVYVFAWNGTRWVAGGQGTNRIAYSSDGLNWIASASGSALFTNNCQAVAWNGTRWVAGGAGTNQLAYSSDGINWTASTSGNGVITTGCIALAWNGTIFVAGGQGSNRLAYSSDGITWTASTSGNDVFTSCSAVAWNGTKWVAGGYSETNRLAYSSDGINWTASTSGNAMFTGSCNAVAWNGTRWVAGGQGSNKVIYSTDGETWTASASGSALFSGQCSGVAWNGTRWVATGSGSDGFYSLAYSSDGITWTGSSSGNTLFSSCYGVASTRVLPSTSPTTPPVVPQYTAAEGGPIPLNSLSATTPFLVESLYSPTSTLTRHFVNAEQFAQNTATPTHAQLTTNNVLGKTPWNKYMKGRIYEILVYNVQHTQDQRFFVEAYLLNKWRAFAFGPTSTATPPCLWLDSYNTEKLTLSGTDITAWNDSSASGVNYASMFSQAHPQYSYDPVTKKYGVLFGSKGVTSGLGNPTTSPFASTITEVSIFVVARFNNTFTTNTMYSSQSGASPMRFTAKNGNPFFGITTTATPANGVANTFTFSSTVITSPFVFSSVSITASDTNTIWVNGTQAYTVSEAISITSGTLVYLGYGVNSPLLSVSQGYNGYMFEYIIYPYGVSTAERQKIEGYLAWKWGIQTSLPAAHPYYLSAP